MHDVDPLGGLDLDLEAGAGLTDARLCVRLYEALTVSGVHVTSSCISSNASRADR